MKTSLLMFMSCCSVKFVTKNSKDNLMNVYKLAVDETNMYLLNNTNI